jgi:hypothetical protein
MESRERPFMLSLAALRRFSDNIRAMALLLRMLLKGSLTLKLPVDSRRFILSPPVFMRALFCPSSCLVRISKV